VSQIRNRAIDLESEPWFCYLLAMWPWKWFNLSVKFIGLRICLNAKARALHA
jgi:hypothetical protein